MDEDELLTLGELIELLESRARRVGRDSKVSIDGFDPGRIQIDDNYDPDYYGEEVKTLLLI